MERKDQFIKTYKKDGQNPEQLFDEAVKLCLRRNN